MKTKSYLIRYSCHDSSIEKCTKDSWIAAMCGDHGGWIQWIQIVGDTSTDQVKKDSVNRVER